MSCVPFFEMNMGLCEHNADRWLDHLYGLLNDGESRELADHAALCPSCQTTLAEARREQRHMARAACLIRNMPEFEAPAEELPRVTAPAAVETPASPATLPLRKHVRRSLAQRLWPNWVAAAALLLAIFSALEWHRRGTGDREQAVADAKKQREAVEGKFVDLRLQADAEQKALWQQAKRDTLRLSVIGPAQIHHEAASAYRIAARDLDGKPLDAKLEIRLVHGESGEVVHRDTVNATGEVDVVIPAGLKLTKDLRLEVAAKHGTKQAEVRETIRVSPANHVVHLALNKSMYQLGEVVFFRALALERYNLKPPSQPLPLKVALVNAEGKSVLNVDTAAGPGGMASGEFALVSTLPAGMYTMQVVAADPKLQIQAQTRQVEIVEQLSDLDIRPERDSYRAGDKIVMNLAARGSDGKPLTNQVVLVKPNLANKPDVKAIPGFRALTDLAGKASVNFSIPKDFQGSRLNVVFEIRSFSKEGKSTYTKVERSIAVVPSRLEVDFYPEGGNLIAGVPQRVFFRVRTPSGETATPDSPFTLHSSKGLIFRSQPAQSLGSFTFTPDPLEIYTLRCATGNCIPESKDPFHKLKIQREGAALHVANSVAKEGETAKLQIRQSGTDRPMLVVASCRGQIVGQQFVEASASQVEMKLPEGVRGIVRVTLYEVKDQRLTPLAERLIYRTPAQRLEVKATATNVEANKTALVKIEVRDGNKAAATAWGLALVVDDRYRAEARERSLPGHFLLAGDMGGDLAEVPLLADDTPATRQAIDLFLATLGWRRFVTPAQPEPAQIAKSESTPSLISAVSSTDEQARIQVIAQAARGFKALQDRVDREQGQLEEQRQQSAASLTAALAARGEFERLPMEYFRIGLGVLAATAFLAGAIGLVIGLVRAARRRASTPAFAAAIGALGLCLVLYFSAGFGQQIDDVRPLGPDLAANKPLPRIEVVLDKNLAIVPAVALDGQLALVSPARPTAPSAPRHAMDLSRSIAMDGPTPVLDTSRSNFVKHPEMQKRFQAAEKVQQTMPPPSADYGREFAPRRQNDLTDLQPTLLWHPQLKIENGQATLRFDVPQGPASYRLLIYGHTADGRLGFHESRMDVKAK